MTRNIVTIIAGINLTAACRPKVVIKPDRFLYALRRNKRILAGFLGSGKKAKTTRHHLLSEGFQFKYHTHIAETAKGGQYVYCFDLGYRPIDCDHYLLVREKQP